MFTSINHNLMADNTARNLNTHYGNLATSTQRLSSGLRINGASDDAAGLAIRELMRADIAALNQGVRNANDAISMIQVVDGALGVIDEKLIRMKELAEQAATGTYDSTQRLMIDSDFQAMASEIDRIANATDFNGIHLLNGSLDGKHDGSGLNSSGAIKIHFGNANDSAEDYYYINIGAATVAGLGLVDQANHTEIIEAPIFPLTNDDDLNHINGTVSLGVRLEDGNGITLGHIYLEHTFNDGKIVSRRAFDEDGLEVVYDDLVQTNTDNINLRYIETPGKFTSPIAHIVHEPVSCINTYTDIDTGDVMTTGIEFRWYGPSYSEYGRFNGKINIAYLRIYENEIQYKLMNSDGTMHTLKYNDVGINVTGDRGTIRNLTINRLKEVEESPVYASIETQDKAQKMLVRLEDAIISKDQIRANLGAMQNRLENTVSNLTIQSENLQASESRISDVDVATEMTNFVRNQILTQSAVAMLSQANSMPQMAMQLIGG